MRSRRQAGKATGSILFLLVLLSAAGGWNYHRNWQIEQESAEKRPYEGYAEGDLQALKQAYQAELATMTARYESARRQRSRPQGDRGSISGNVDQFAQTTRASRNIRSAAAEVAERQDQIAELDRELELRARLGEGLMRHVKRLTTI